jgi:hypothetical protein
MSEPSNNPFEDANASHPLDLLINAISGSGEYEIPNEARDGHGEFNLEQLLSNNTDEHRVCQLPALQYHKLIIRTRGRDQARLLPRETGR